MYTVTLHWAPEDAPTEFITSSLRSAVAFTKKWTKKGADAYIEDNMVKSFVGYNEDEKEFLVHHSEHTEGAYEKINSRNWTVEKGIKWRKLADRQVELIGKILKMSGEKVRAEIE